MSFKKIFLNRSFWKAAIPIVLPIALQNLLAASFSMIDTVMVSILGDTTLSAVGMASQFSWLMNMFLFGLASGTAIFISQFWGAKDVRSIHKVEGISLICSFVLGLAFTLGGFFFAEEIISVFSKTPEVIKIGSGYLRFVCWSYLPNTVAFTLSTVLRSTENVKLPVYVSITNAVVNAILNYILIFGKLGLPQMGAEGAALATAIANWITLILLVVICLKQKSIIIAPPKEMFSIKKEQMADYFKKALPALINEGIFALGTITLNAILSNMGDDYYAGVTVLRTVENLAFAFIVGICNACSILLGISIGAGNIKEAKEDSLRFNFIMPVFSLITTALLIFFRNPIVWLFTNRGEYSQIAISSAVWCLIVYAINMPIRNIGYLMIVGIFRPGGDPKTGMICDVVPLWLIAIPLTAIFAYIVGLPFETVFFLLYLLEDVPKAIMCIGYYISGKWIRPVTEEGKAALTKLSTNNKTV